MQMLPSLAEGDSNKVWIVPSELNDALKGLGSAVGEASSSIPSAIKGHFKAPEKIDVQSEIEVQKNRDAADADRIVKEAIQAAADAEKPASLSSRSSSSPAALQLSSEQQSIAARQSDPAASTVPTPAGDGGAAGAVPVDERR